MKSPSYLSQTQSSLTEQTEMAGVLDALYLDRILKPQQSGGDTNLRERSAKFKLGAFLFNDRVAELCDPTLCELEKKVNLNMLNVGSRWMLTICNA